MQWCEKSPWPNGLDGGKKGYDQFFCECHPLAPRFFRFIKCSRWIVVVRKMA